MKFLWPTTTEQTAQLDDNKISKMTTIPIYLKKVSIVRKKEEDDRPHKHIVYNSEKGSLSAYHVER